MAGFFCRALSRLELMVELYPLRWPRTLPDWQTIPAQMFLEGLGSVPISAREGDHPAAALARARLHYQNDFFLPYSGQLHLVKRNGGFLDGVIRAGRFLQKGSGPSVKIFLLGHGAPPLHECLDDPTLEVRSQVSVNVGIALGLRHTI